MYYITGYIIQYIILLGKEEKMARKMETLRGELAEDYLYEIINAHAGLSIYELAKFVGWSTGKVYHIVKALEQEGLVRTEKIEEGGRIKKQVYPVDWEELLPEDVKRNLFAKEVDKKSDKASAERHAPLIMTA
jgi:predicted transcriptional regulator